MFALRSRSSIIPQLLAVNLQLSDGQAHAPPTLPRVQSKGAQTRVSEKNAVDDDNTARRWTPSPHPQDAQSNALACKVLAQPYRIVRSEPTYSTKYRGVLNEVYGRLCEGIERDNKNESPHCYILTRGRGTVSGGFSCGERSDLHGHLTHSPSHCPLQLSPTEDAFGKERNTLLGRTFSWPFLSRTYYGSRLEFYAANAFTSMSYPQSAITPAANISVSPY